VLDASVQIETRPRAEADPLQIGAAGAGAVPPHLAPGSIGRHNAIDPA
jgi:hypothetical protein